MKQPIKMILVWIAAFLSVSCGEETPDPNLSGTWTQVAPLPGAARQGAVSFVLGTEAWVGLGRDRDGQLLTDFWRYDPATDTWQQGPAFPGQARQSALAFVAGGKAYVGTGENGQSPLRDVWCYDPAGATWSQIADFAGSACFGGVGFSGNDAGLVICGGSIWRYQPATGQWTAAQDFPGIDRNFAVSFLLEGRAWLGMGNPPGQESLSDAWSYDIATNSWESESAFRGGPRSLATAFAIGDQAFAGGGYNGTPLEDWWKYDALQSTWVQVRGPGAALYAATACVIGNAAYFGTGFEGISGTTFGDETASWWRFDP